MHPVRAVHFPLTATIVATVTVIALVFVGRSTVEACQIPVFRYALERWEPDLFEVTVYHRGALNDSETALVEKLKSKGVAWGGESLADLIVVPGDEDAHEDHEDKEDKQEEDKEGKTKAEDGKSFANFRIQTVDLASLKPTLLYRRRSATWRRTPCRTWRSGFRPRRGS